MTVGELFTGFFSSITEFLAYFINVFFWNINWWDAHFLVVLVVILSYLYVIGWAYTFFSKLSEDARETFRFFTDKTYREAYSEARLKEKQADKLYRKRELDEARETLSRLGFLMVKFPTITFLIQFFLVSAAFIVFLTIIDEVFL